MSSTALVIQQPLMCRLPEPTLRWWMAYWQMVAGAAQVFDDLYHADRMVTQLEDEIFDHPLPSCESDPLPTPIVLATSEDIDSGADDCMMCGIYPTSTVHDSGELTCCQACKSIYPHP